MRPSERGVGVGRGVVAPREDAAILGMQPRVG